MLKIGMGYNIINLNELYTEGIRIDEKGRDGKEPFVKGRVYFNYSHNFYALVIYLQDNQNFTCYTNHMAAEDSVKSIKSESKMFHIMIKYIFKPETKRIEIK